MDISKARFKIGQRVQSLLFEYQGVVIDVDLSYQMPDELYEKFMITHPPKDQPWYRILVENTDQELYVAEKCLVPYYSKDPVDHPLVKAFLKTDKGGGYRPRFTMN